MIKQNIFNLIWFINIIYSIGWDKLGWFESNFSWRIKNNVESQTCYALRKKLFFVCIKLKNLILVIMLR